MSKGYGLRAEQVESALVYRETVQQMMADPDLKGDVLLLALAMHNRFRLKAEAGEKQSLTWTDVYADLGWKVHDLRHVFHTDFPRYEPDKSQPVTCGAPMIRRDGPCGKKPHYSLVFTDRNPVTGEGREVGFCSRHGELQHEVRRRIQDWVANDRPQPPDNTGGVLRRYFSGDLDVMYRWAKPWGKLAGAAPNTPPPRPRLTLIQGGAA